MGVANLLKFCKEGASSSQDFSRGDEEGLLLIDGGMMMHRCFTQQGVASSLLDGSVMPLAKACVEFVRSLQDAGWKVIVVFDGQCPPAKAGTSAARRQKRAAALTKMHQSSSGSERTKFEKQAVGTSSRVTARVSRIVSRSCGIETFTAPYEADAQLVFMEAQLSVRYPRTFIYATDADIIVIGAKNLVWDIRNKSRLGLEGQVISRHDILRPKLDMLRDPVRGSFLRKLHGVSEGCEDIRVEEDASIVEQRLFGYGCIAGNDYFKLRGIAAGHAINLAMQPVTPIDNGTAGAEAWSQRLATRVSCHGGRNTKQDALEGIRISTLMFRHSVVWDYTTGLQRRHHPLVDSAYDNEEFASRSTGHVSRDADVSRALASGKTDPSTGQEWDGPLEEDGTYDRQGKRASLPADGRPPLKSSGRAGNSATRRSLPPPTFPPPDGNFDNWHADVIRRWLNNFRCMERTGASNATKAQLVVMAENVTRALGALICCDDPRHKRAEAQETTRVQTRQQLLPFLPAERLWVTDPIQLRPELPELHEAVIIAWLSGTEPRKNYAARNLYRGMQRALDLGGLDGLAGVPNPAGGGDLWVRLRPQASMESHTYTVYARLEVTRVATEDSVCANVMDRADAESGHGESHIARMVATRVLAALCECQSGVNASCHHIAMLLQLLRLLQMSSKEISEFDPTTVTGRDCAWIMNHAKGGRDAENNLWWGLTLPEVHVKYSQMRDPKGQLPCSQQDAPLKTAGVVQGDRLHGFNPHPRFGHWAELRKHFDEGTSISAAQNVSVVKLLDSVRAAKKSNRRGRDADSGDVVLAVDELPPRVRLSIV